MPLPTESGDEAYTQTAKFASIHQIKMDKGRAIFYRTAGFVIGKYKCPPCPPPLLCKPCGGEKIFISENNIAKPIELSDKEMILFTKKTDSFKIGKQYYFSIRVTEWKSTGEPLNDVELVSFEKK